MVCRARALTLPVMPASYVESNDFTDMAMTAGKGRTYRYYTDTPLYPFGFGLSYTTFTLKLASQIRTQMAVLPAGYAETDSPSFTVTVTNTGTVTGDEVVQAYFLPQADVKPSAQPAHPPIRQLFSFERVRLAAGASATVTVTVPPSALALADANGDLVSVPGHYVIQFTNGNHGSSVAPEGDADATVTTTIQLTGSEKIIEAYPK